MDKRRIIEEIINSESIGMRGITDYQKGLLLEELVNSETPLEIIRYEVRKRLNLIEQNNIEMEETPKTMEEQISQEYGMDLGAIRHYRIQDGTEMFQFYDNNTGKTILIENTKKDIAVEDQFKIEQEALENAQSDNNSKNAIEVLKYQRTHGNEITLVPINELSNYTYLINGLKPEQLDQLTALVEKRDELGIQYINIEHCIAMDGNQRVLEVRRDNNSMEYKVESIKEIDDTSYSDAPISSNDIELEEENPSEEMQVDETEQRSLDAPKVREKKKKNPIGSNGGFVDAVILAFIVGCVSGLFSMILIRIINNSY